MHDNKNIAIFDPGLSTKIGHHFDQNIRISKELGNKGYTVTVICHKSVNQKVIDLFGRLHARIIPAFDIHAYATLNKEQNTYENWHALVQRTMNDLEQVPAHDLEIWPSLNPVCFSAALMRSKYTKTVICLDGQINQYCTFGAELIHGATKQRLYKDNQNLLVGCFENRIADIYKTIIGGDVSIEKLPILYDSITFKKPETKVAGFFGHQRKEKGTDLILPLCNILLERGYEIIIQDSGNYFKNSKSVNPKINILGYVDDIPAEMCKCSLIVWPTLPHLYLTKTSGIVWQSIALGIPIIMPSLSLPAQVANDYGAGFFYHTPTVQSFSNAITQMENSKKYFDKDSIIKKWKRQNGVRNFVGKLQTWLEEN